MELGFQYVARLNLVLLSSSVCFSVFIVLLRLMLDVFGLLFVSATTVFSKMRAMSKIMKKALILPAMIFQVSAAVAEMGERT